MVSTNLSPVLQFLPSREDRVVGSEIKYTRNGDGLVQRAIGVIVAPILIDAALVLFLDSDDRFVHLTNSDAGAGPDNRTGSLYIVTQTASDKKLSRTGTTMQITLLLLR